MDNNELEKIITLHFEKMDDNISALRKLGEKQSELIIGQKEFLQDLKNNMNNMNSNYHLSVEIMTTKNAEHIATVLEELKNKKIERNKVIKALVIVSIVLLLVVSGISLVNSFGLLKVI